MDNGYIMVSKAMTYDHPLGLASLATEGWLYDLNVERTTLPETDHTSGCITPGNTLFLVLHFDFFQGRTKGNVCHIGPTHHHGPLENHSGTASEPLVYPVSVCGKNASKTYKARV